MTRRDTTDRTREMLSTTRASFVLALASLFSNMAWIFNHYDNSDTPRLACAVVAFAILLGAVIWIGKLHALLLQQLEV